MQKPAQLILEVPTYKADDFYDPHVPVTIRDECGVRVVLGTADDPDAPDIAIERRPGGWAIFLHPVGGSDASGYVYFLDDGRSFLAPETFGGPTPPIRVLPSHESPAEIDRPPKRRSRRRPSRSPDVPPAKALPTETSRRVGPATPFAGKLKQLASRVRRFLRSS